MFRVVRRGVAVCSAILAVIVAHGFGAGTAAAGSAGSGANPLAGTTFWVNPNAPAVAQAATYRAAGDPTDAALMDKIATHPTSVWLTADASWVWNAISFALSDSAARGTVPVFVLYYIPNRDCGGFSSGGAPDYTAYATWVRKVATQLGSRRVVVIVEPDAVPLAATGTCSTASQAYQALKDAITVLKTKTSAAVYLDAGHSTWYPDPTKLVTPLNSSGVGKADGFSLNVSNFQYTSSETTYGNKLSSLIGGRHYVIDTSRNGLGPLPPGSTYPGPSWCNPPDRALGVPATSSTGQSLVDAYLWIKTPGISDGTCGLGYPSAGTWWPDYALGLAKLAAW